MLIQLLISVGLCLAVGAIAGVSTAQSISTWYDGLTKPSFNPPNWVFGPVWTLLYVMMGIALFLVWRSTKSFISLAVAVFVFQLVLNFAWSILFFSVRSPVAALVDIALLWLAILTTIALFYPISKLAAWLLVPYLAWVTFAAALNWEIVRLN